MKLPATNLLCWAWCDGVILLHWYCWRLLWKQLQWASFLIGKVKEKWYIIWVGVFWLLLIFFPTGQAQKFLLLCKIRNLRFMQTSSTAKCTSSDAEIIDSLCKFPQFFLSWLSMCQAPKWISAISLSTFEVRSSMTLANSWFHFKTFWFFN